MDTKIDEMLKDALALPTADRALLAEHLIRSLDEQVDVDVDAAWEQEITARLGELRSGKVACIPWEVVRDRLRNRRRDEP